MSFFGNAKCKQINTKIKSILNSSGNNGGGGGVVNGSNDVSNGSTFIGPDGVRVDEEGYIIRNDVPSRKDEDDHFYSSSDDDSEDEKQEKRFKFEIKPANLTNGGPSVAELQKTVKGLSISPSLQQGVRMYNGSSSLSKSISSNSIMDTPPPMSIPRPPTKRSLMSPSISHPNNITRCKSYGSLSSDLRMTPVSVNSSRGPSPLTLGLTNVIPIAVAIQECISARFKGSDESKCKIQIIGSLKIAFPSGIIQVFANNTCPALLSFKLTNSSRFERLIPNKDIVMQNKNIENGIKTDTYSFDMNMVGLTNHLRKLSEQSPNSRYFNAEILKYQLKARGATFCPLQVVSHWKCEPSTTGLKVDYKYNACALSSIQPLKNVTFSVNVDGGVKSHKTTPNASWNEEKKEISWKFDEISIDSEGKGLGSLKAKFDVTDGPSTPGSVSVQFNGNSTTFSGVEFLLNCIGYRISLMKKQISTGRYLSEADSSVSYACI
ncbi:F-BAR domain only protein 2 [Tetranychus urticae]|uniref:MHD domain-containing protein n=1 Tax=Tetranychus urticae TaxID=32264 RepID=T1L1U7_TETUR|nr:F-BAR domain only protein 2 [Tetranychus urticae]